MRSVQIPVRHFLFKGDFLAFAKHFHFRFDRMQESVVLGQVENFFGNADRFTAIAEGYAQAVEFALGHRIKADLVEEAQQPRLAVDEDFVLQEFVPDRQRAPHELIAAR